MARTIAAKLTMPPRDQQAGQDLLSTKVAALYTKANTIYEHATPPMVLDIVSDSASEDAHVAGDVWRYRLKRPRGEELPAPITVQVRAELTGAGSTVLRATDVATSDYAEETLTASGKATIELDAFDEGDTFDLEVEIMSSSNSAVRLETISVAPSRDRTEIPTGVGGVEVGAAAARRPLTVERHRRAAALLERTRAEQWGQAAAASSPHGWPRSDLGEVVTTVSSWLEIPDRKEGGNAALVFAVYLDGSDPGLVVTFAGKTAEPTLSAGWTEFSLEIPYEAEGVERPRGDLLEVTIDKPTLTSFCAWWEEP